MENILLLLLSAVKIADGKKLLVDSIRKNLSFIYYRDCVNRTTGGEGGTPFDENYAEMRGPSPPSSPSVRVT